MPVFQLGLLGAVYLGFGFVSDWEYGDLLDFLIIILHLDYFRIFILRKKMPNVERPYKAFGSILPALYIIIASAICIALLYTKTSNESG
jgi:APA family basic amino acid/polyamine antiporter